MTSFGQTPILKTVKTEPMPPPATVITAQKRPWIAGVFGDHLVPIAAAAERNPAAGTDNIFKTSLLLPLLLLLVLLACRVIRCPERRTAGDMAKLKWDSRSADKTNSPLTQKKERKKENEEKKNIAWAQ